MYLTTQITPASPVSVSGRQWLRKHLIMLIFKNQIANIGAFADEDSDIIGHPQWWAARKFANTIIIIMTVLLAFLLLVVYIYRHECSRLNQIIGRLNRQVQIVNQARTIVRVGEYQQSGRDEILATYQCTNFSTNNNATPLPVVSEEESCSENSAETDAAETVIDTMAAPVLPPSYQDLSPSFPPEYATDDPNEPEENADESDVRDEETGRPYPLMLYPGCPINVVEPPHVV